MNNLLKKSNDLITWWKLEWGVTIVSFSFLIVIIGITTEWASTSLDGTISIKEILEETSVLILAILIILTLVSLLVIGIFKCFKVLNSLDKLLQEVSEENTKQILKRSKILIISIVCLTLFPLIALFPQTSIFLLSGISICKLLFCENNKKILYLKEGLIKFKK